MGKSISIQIKFQIALIGLCILASLQPHCLFAQGISGKILLDKSTPLPNATVTAYQNNILKGHSATDSIGFFSISLTDTGLCTLMINYSDKEDTIKIQEMARTPGMMKSFHYITFIFGERYFYIQGTIEEHVPGNYILFDEPGIKTFTREELNGEPSK